MSENKKTDYKLIIRDGGYMEEIPLKEKPELFKRTKTEHIFKEV